MKNQGRKPKFLSAVVRERVLEGIAQGLPYTSACRLAGITDRTLENWRKWSQDPKHNHIKVLVAFFRDIKECEAKAEERWLKVIEAASGTPKHWTAAAWLLERRFPEKWAKQERVHQEHSGALEIVLKVTEAKTNGNRPT